MTYEVKVVELAEEFNVHRNTVRNWINSGTLPARKGPGRRYLIEREDYLRLCEKYGRRSRLKPKPVTGVGDTAEAMAVPVKQPVPATRLGQHNEPLYKDASRVSSCLTCGSCAGACPMSGVDDLDPQKIIRLALLGLNDLVLQADWPWKCTLCGRCELACPMEIEIVDFMRGLRGLRKRTEIPGALQKGVVACLERGNNLGIPKDDFVQLVEGLGGELAKDSCPGFVPQIDVRGARLLVTVNSSVVFAEPDAMQWWWRVFHAAGESWTMAADNWEGVNYGYCTGDDDAMKTIVGRIVDSMEQLGCQALLLPDSGHASYATRLGLARWFPEALEKYKIYTLFELLLEYINDRRIVLDQGQHTQLTTYHDSCYHGRRFQQTFGHGYFQEGRELTRACCRKFIEMTPSGNRSWCCGAGGGAWSMPFAPERVFHGRFKAEQIRETGAELIVTSCPSCRDQIVHTLCSEFDLRVDVKCVWELMADALLPSS